jgi:hypothetical protein
MKSSSQFNQSLLALAFLSLTLLNSGCNSGTTPGSGKTTNPGPSANCIEVPKVSDEKQKNIAAEIAAKLEKLPVSGDIQGKYDTLVKEEYARLSDDNMALLLFLNAIHCYLNDNKVGKDIALLMADTVRKRWAAKQGFSGTDKKLSPAEKEKINESEYAKLLNERLSEVGLKD